LNDVSEERIASIFRVEDKKKSESEPAWAGAIDWHQQSVAPAHPGSLSGFFYPEDGGDTFQRNVG
jgi:hypothetical protein